VFPRWNLAQTLNTNTERNNIAKRHLINLFTANRDFLRIGGIDNHNNMTYNEWSIILNKISTNNYWTKNDSCCVHVINSDISSDEEYDDVQEDNKGKGKKWVKKEEIKPIVKKEKKRKTKRTKKNVSSQKETQILIISSDESLSSSDFSSSSESESSAKPRRKDTRETVEGNRKD
jgi:molecular chaperone DnaK (HSP70)